MDLEWGGMLMPDAHMMHMPLQSCRCNPDTEPSLEAASSSDQTFQQVGHLIPSRLHLKLMIRHYASAVTADGWFLQACIPVWNCARGFEPLSSLQ